MSGCIPGISARWAAWRGRLRYLPGVMLFFSVASLSMPGTGNFVGEFPDPGRQLPGGSCRHGGPPPSVWCSPRSTPHRACSAPALAPPRMMAMLKGLDRRELTMMMVIAGLLVLLGLYPQPRD